MFLSNRGSFRPETSGAYTLRRRGRRRPKSGSAIGACAVARLAGSGGPIGDYYGSANKLGERLRAATGLPLREITAFLRISSSYEYRRARLGRPDKYAALRARVRELFEEGSRNWGYRTVWARLRREGVSGSRRRWCAA